MIGVIALLVYLGLIIFWVTVLKRNIGEAMILGFLAVLPFLGGQWLTAGWAALWDALTDEIVYATMMFVFMGFLLERVGVMIKMINLLNSLLGPSRAAPPMSRPWARPRWAASSTTRRPSPQPSVRSPSPGWSARS